MSTSYTDRTKPTTTFTARKAGGDIQIWADADTNWADTLVGWDGSPIGTSVTNRSSISTTFTTRTSP